MNYENRFSKSGHFRQCMEMGISVDARRICKRVKTKVFKPNADRSDKAWLAG